MYWVELHIHTEIGSLDSTLNLVDLLGEYNRLGVDGVFITEHIRWEAITLDEYNKLYGAYKKGIEERYNIDIYPGAEVKIKNGYEYLVLGIKIPYEWFGLDWDETVKRIHSEGGIVIKSHPYRDENEVIPIDGIEVYNFCSNDKMNKSAFELTFSNLNLITTVGCDAHSVDVTGMAITVLKEKPRDAIELVKKIKNKEIEYYIICGKILKMEEIYETIFNGTNDC